MYLICTFLQSPPTKRSSVDLSAARRPCCWASVNRRRGEMRLATATKSSPELPGLLFHVDHGRPASSRRLGHEAAGQSPCRGTVAARLGLSRTTTLRCTSAHLRRRVTFPWPRECRDRAAHMSPRTRKHRTYRSSAHGRRTPTCRRPMNLESRMRSRPAPERPR